MALCMFRPQIRRELADHDIFLQRERETIAATPPSEAAIPVSPRVRKRLSAFPIGWVFLFAAGLLPSHPSAQGIQEQSADALAAQAAVTDNSSSDDFERLLRIAGQDGLVNVIVERYLPTVFQAEGTMAVADQSRQRNSIAQATGELKDELRGTKARIYREYDALPLLAIQVDEKSLDSIRRSTRVKHIYEDELSSPSLEVSAPFIGAPTAWSYGLTGSGQTVAIVDTGIDTNHPFFGSDFNRVSTAICFSNGSGDGVSLCPNGTSSQNDGKYSADVNIPACMSGSSNICDHGTHVAGIAAGASATRNGVAPHAGIVAAQVFTRFNNATKCTSFDLSAPCVAASTSDIIAALNTIYNSRNNGFNFASVNMSLGSGRYTAYCVDPTKSAIDNLRSVGIATIAAAGNKGYTDAISSPACISSAVAVTSGNIGCGGTCDGGIAGYSNMASIVDLVAPGSSITSSIPGGDYHLMSGTSMSAPHVAGAWALMKQANPALSVTDILGILVSTGKPIFDQRPGGTITKPRIQLKEAIDAALLTAPKISASERQVLLDLYNSTNGDEWTNNAGWGGPPGTECYWDRLLCSSSREHVAHLFLPDNELTGNLPWSFSGLTNLESFDAESNQLTGSIPSLQGLTNLKGFHVSGNQLTGSIPSLQGLTNLKDFHVSGNQLTGSIPSLQGLTNLGIFRANLNQLTGSIPSLQGLTNLGDFGVGSNQLTGSIPSLQGLTNLGGFDASSNQLSGAIPSLQGLTNLEKFSVTGNQLTGEIPSLQGLTKLRLFYASSNQLTGSIPSLQGLMNLGDFGVGSNQLTGSIPSLQGLTKLGFFNANSNQLTGSIPSLQGLRYLEFFSVSYNQLSGVIPSLQGLTNLYDFIVSYNQLSGEIPSLQELTDLHIFSVSNNQLSGEVPAVPSPNYFYRGGGAALCPNDLNPTPNADWDEVTGVFPWYRNCSSDLDPIFASGFEAAGGGI